MSKVWKKKWSLFKENIPHCQAPYNARNWGNPNHSLCSYQGKLKPAIAYHLVNTFCPKGGSIFDPFSGVGTIPFEAALNGKQAYGMDISEMAYYISEAKVGKTNKKESLDCINALNQFINTQHLNNTELNKYNDFGFNKTLPEYYEKNTYKEILLARLYFLTNRPKSASEMVVVSALLHILHGNRPYALSRRSHPITPYAPQGEYIYKNLIEKLTEKVNKYYKQETPTKYGKIFLQDSTCKWNDEIDNLDCIITSPPFFDSTKFYLANWIRLWFCGWEEIDFKKKPQDFVDERQKEDFAIYTNIFSQAKERLKKDGVFVLHLGKSKKCNMGEILRDFSKKWFDHTDLFDESVIDCETFGISDIGSVTDHQYLVLW